MNLIFILVKSDAFMLLKQRLDCVPNYYNKIAENSSFGKLTIANDESQSADLSTKEQNQIDFKQLLQHFIQVQKKHKFFKRNTIFNANKF
jgi:hypothetical protein